MSNFFNKDREVNGEDKKDSFALYLLFDKTFVMDEAKIVKRIQKINSDKVSVSPILPLDGNGGLFSYVTINNERFKLVGIDSAIPKEINSYTIDCAYGKKEELEAMSNHNYHIIAFYEGISDDINHILDLYFKLAYGFLEHDLLGLANIYSWNVLTPSLIQGMAEDEQLNGYSNTPSMMIWRNFVKIPHNNGIWFTTKGNNLYGIHEIAFYGTFEDTKEVYDTFEDIFYYVYESKAEINVGHTIQIGEELYLRFREVYELYDDLKGEGIGALVMEKITGLEINQ